MRRFRVHWTLHPEKAKGLYYDEETGKPRSPWYDNEILSKEMTPSAVARELDINPELSVEGIVFPEFREMHIMRSPYEVDQHAPVIRTLDYGGTCAALFSQKDAYGRIVFFHEIMIEKKGNARVLGQAVQSYSADLHCAGFRDHDDPAGENDKWVNGDSSAQIIRLYDINPTHRVSGSSAHRRKDRIEMIHFKLSELVDGAPAMMVHESCVYTIESFQSGYRFLEDSNGKIDVDVIDEMHPSEDVMDCVGMTLMEQFQVVKNTNAKPFNRKRNRDKVTGY